MPGFSDIDLTYLQGLHSRLWLRRFIFVSENKPLTGKIFACFIFGLFNVEINMASDLS